jgi:hypothetical protein
MMILMPTLALSSAWIKARPNNKIHLTQRNVNWGLLKKPDRLQRSLFQRSRADKLASTRAIHDCYNC